MSAMRRHARRVPPQSAAVIFAVEGDQMAVTLVPPAGKPENGTPPEHMQLAIACARWAVELLEGDEEQGE